MGSRDLKKVAGIVGAPLTSGLSLGLTAKETLAEKKRKKEKEALTAAAAAEREQSLSAQLAEQKRKQQLSDYYGNNQIGTNPVSGSPFKTLLGQ